MRTAEWEREKSGLHGHCSLDVPVTAQWVWGVSQGQGQLVPSLSSEVIWFLAVMLCFRSLPVLGQSFSTPACACRAVVAPPCRSRPPPPAQTP